MKKMLFAAVTTLIAQSVLAAGIQVGEAYAYPTMPKMSQGGAFLSLTNTDDQDDVLLGATVDKKFAKKTAVEVHTHINDNGVMRMVQIKEGLELPAGKTQELKRGSYHLMFYGLNKPLKVGDKFDMTLKFKRNQPQTVTVTVREQQHQADGKGHNHEHHH